MGVTKEKGYTLISKTNVSFTKRRSYDYEENI